MTYTSGFRERVHQRKMKELDGTITRNRIAAAVGLAALLTTGVLKASEIAIERTDANWYKLSSEFYSK